MCTWPALDCSTIGQLTVHCGGRSAQGCPATTLPAARVSHPCTAHWFQPSHDTACPNKSCQEYFSSPPAAGYTPPPTTTTITKSWRLPHTRAHCGGISINPPHTDTEGCVCVQKLHAMRSPPAMQRCACRCVPEKPQTCQNNNQGVTKPMMPKYLLR